MKLAVLTRFGGLGERLAEEPPEDVQLVVLPDGPGVDGATDAEVAIVGDPDRLRALLSVDLRLRWVHTPAAGVDRLVIPELVAREEVVLTNNTGSYDAQIAEFVVASLFVVAKRFPVHLANQRRRHWPRGQDVPQHHELREATLVVVGLGSIGAELARLASGLGMRVLGVRRSGGSSPHCARVATPDRLVELAREADYLAVTAALTPETRGLVSREVVAALPAHAWVVNIARGHIVDEGALLEALREKRIGGAVIDAWWDEPLPEASAWWDLPNVVVTPHHSNSSPRLVERSVALFRENLRRFRAGEPLLNVVDKRAGY